MDWTTYFARGRPERSLAGVVLDSESLDGIDIGAERTNRVQITATSDEALSNEDMSHLVEFLDVAARALGRCAAGPTQGPRRGETQGATQPAPNDSSS